MCNHSARLVAWLDREVSGCEASEIESHLRTCSECRARVDQYERYTIRFDEYCNFLLAGQPSRNSVSPNLVFLAAAAVILLILALVYPRRGATPSLHHSSPSVAAIVPAALPAAPDRQNSALFSKPRPKIYRRHARVSSALRLPQSPQQPQNLVVSAPAIQIAIPADAMFPPGALPEGMNFVADLSIGADGSVEQLRLWPRPVQIERRSNQP